MSIPPSSDALIIGGGIIGLSTAYFLAKAGLRVAVLDKSDMGGESSWAGAGILPGGNPRRANSPVGRLRALSMEMFPELSQELRERTRIDNGYSRCGGFEIQRSDDDLERRRVANVKLEERGVGLTSEVLDRSQLQELEPALSELLAGAIYYKDMAQVRNPYHVQALIVACEQLGVTLLRHSPVYEIKKSGGKVESIRSAHGELHSGQYLVTAGAWAAELLSPLGYDTGIKPMRGQIALLNTGQPIINRVVMADAHYLVPRADGRVLVGSTVEDVGFDKRNTAAVMQDLLQGAMRLAPALADAPVEKCWAGLRPGNREGRPFMSRVPDLENLFIAAGHFRAGIELSPITGKLMSQLMLTGQPDALLEPFALNL